MGEGNSGARPKAASQFFSHEDLFIARIARISTCQFFLSNWGGMAFVTRPKALLRGDDPTVNLTLQKGPWDAAGKGKKTL